MTYIRSLFFNFLCVFFIHNVMPGIETKTFENVPNIGADILFSLIVGFLNASIFPVFVFLEIKPTVLRFAITAFIISFGAFAMIGIFDLGVKILNFWGVFFGALIVFLAAVFSNYLEYKHVYKD